MRNGLADRDHAACRKELDVHSLDSAQVEADAERISESINASLRSPLLIDRQSNEARV
jgi:hypothetical protein